MASFMKKTIPAPSAVPKKGIMTPDKTLNMSPIFKRLPS